MAYSVVILSKEFDNLNPCVKAIVENEQKNTPRVMVVDDGLKDWAVWPEYINGVKPFVFARNANIGIKAVAPDDVILMNDDAILRSPCGFSGLEKVSKANPDYGVIASTADGVGNPDQHPRNKLVHPMLRDESRMVCFVCVYIPRTTIDNPKIGLLDERFTDYGLDDDSYCFTVREAGLKLGIWDGCFVNHSTLVSSYRGHGIPASFTENMRRFIAKHGTDNWGKRREESEFAHLFPVEPCHACDGSGVIDPDLKQCGVCKGTGKKL